MDPDHLPHKNPYSPTSKNFLYQLNVFAPAVHHAYHVQWMTGCIWALRPSPLAKTRFFGLYASSASSLPPQLESFPRFGISLTLTLAKKKILISLSDPCSGQIGTCRHLLRPSGWLLHSSSSTYLPTRHIQGFFGKIFTSLCTIRWFWANLMPSMSSLASTPPFLWLWSTVSSLPTMDSVAWGAMKGGFRERFWEWEGGRI